MKVPELKPIKFQVIGDLIKKIGSGVRRKGYKYNKSVSKRDNIRMRFRHIYYNISMPRGSKSKKASYSMTEYQPGWDKASIDAHREHKSTYIPSSRIAKAIFKLKQQGFKMYYPNRN